MGRKNCGVISVKAFILCGGEGTRLRPYTYSIPKPMLPLGKKPILEFVVSNLKNNGVTDLTMTVGYLNHVIQDYFGDGSKFGVKIKYLVEKERMNTAGSIYPSKDEVKDTFVVVMGDHLTNVNVKKMIAFHKKKRGIGTLGLKRQGVPLEYGIAELDGKELITGFKEKPIISNYVNSGVYVLEPEAFNYIGIGKDFAKNVFPEMMKDGKKLFGYVFDEYWMDIGRIHDYERLNQIISIVDIVEKSK